MKSMRKSTLAKSQRSTPQKSQPSTQQKVKGQPRSKSTEDDVSNRQWRQQMMWLMTLAGELAIADMADDIS